MVGRASLTTFIIISCTRTIYLNISVTTTDDDKRDGTVPTNHNFKLKYIEVLNPISDAPLGSARAPGGGGGGYNDPKLYLA